MTNEARNWYGLDYYPHAMGSVWADQGTRYRPKAGLPAARLFVFRSREARDAWIGEETPSRMTGRYHRDACDASTARSMMIDAIRMDRLAYDEGTPLDGCPIGVLVGEYARLHPDRIVLLDKRDTSNAGVDPADPLNIAMSGMGPIGLTR